MPHDRYAASILDEARVIAVSHAVVGANTEFRRFGTKRGR